MNDRLNGRMNDAMLRRLFSLKSLNGRLQQLTLILALLVVLLPIQSPAASRKVVPQFVSQFTPQFTPKTAKQNSSQAKPDLFAVLKGSGIDFEASFEAPVEDLPELLRGLAYSPQSDVPNDTAYTSANAVEFPNRRLLDRAISLLEKDIENSKYSATFRTSFLNELHDLAQKNKFRYLPTAKSVPFETISDFDPGSEVLLAERLRLYSVERLARAVARALPQHLLRYGIKSIPQIRKIIGDSFIDHTRIDNAEFLFGRAHPLTLEFVTLTSYFDSIGCPIANRVKSMADLRLSPNADNEFGWPGDLLALDSKHQLQPWALLEKVRICDRQFARWVGVYYRRRYPMLISDFGERNLHHLKAAMPDRTLETP